LFNVPEGFARLVLEHKMRPSSRLQAVFAAHAQALVLLLTPASHPFSTVHADMLLDCTCNNEDCHFAVMNADHYCGLWQCGIAGLIMRLREDGHKEVHVLGPSGAYLM
jgi:hypothetical protein